jgi:lysozyme
MVILPQFRPQAPRHVVLAAAKTEWLKDSSRGPMPEVFLFGCRSYYRDSMGVKGKNDRNIYDDMMAIIGPESFVCFNANTDPSPWRKTVATLMAGVHIYKLGNHGQSRPGGGYPALRPATKNEELPVRRDGESQVPSATPGVAINIHKGGYKTTSSLGCQTIHPSQWDAFYALVLMLMKQHSITRIPYILVEGPII